MKPPYDQDAITSVDLTLDELQILDKLLCDAGYALVKHRELHVKLRTAEAEILLRHHTSPS